MKLNRRSFLKLGGASAAAAIVAPAVQQLATAAAFIRPENLDFGVPRGLRAATVTEVAQFVPEVWSKAYIEEVARPGVLYSKVFWHNPETGRDETRLVRSVDNDRGILTFEPDEQVITISKSRYFGTEAKDHRHHDQLDSLSYAIDRSHEQEIAQLGDRLEVGYVDPEPGRLYPFFVSGDPNPWGVRFRT